MNSLNQTFLYKTVSRNSLFFSPFIFQNHLNINGLLFPEHIYRDHLLKVTKIRQENLKKRSIPPQELRKGNIVTDYMMPAVKNPGQSSKIIPVIKQIYCVEQIRDMGARVVNLLDCAEKTLPLNRLMKLNLNHLARIKFYVRSRYLESRLSRLYKNNRYLPPNAAKKWTTLLQSDNQR